MASSEEGRLTIGALSRATGIPIETLRTWERRYGFPDPLRKPSGHRVYPIAAVPRLRRVGEAIARGLRPAEVVSLSESALSDLLASIRVAPGRERPAPRAPSISAEEPAEVRELLAAAAAFDGASFRQGLEARWAAHGPLVFLERVCAPFLVALGEAWSRGTIAVRHEHFASARLADFLREARRPLDERGRGPRAAFLTLPGDQHEIGLLMAALVFALAEWRVLYLGLDTPVDQAAALARDATLGAVAVSVSASSVPGKAATELRTLRRTLPRATPLVVGGRGAPNLPLKGFVRLEGLSATSDWARSHRSEIR